MIETLFGETWMNISRRPAVRRVLDALGIRFVPYYFFLERLYASDLSCLDRSYEAFEFGPMTSEDRTALEKMPGISLLPKDYANRLGAGALGYVLRSGGKPLGHTWISLDKCETIYGKFRLSPDEAYSLHTAITDSYRRKGLAMWMRRKVYEELQKSGREYLYSHVMVFNGASVGFHNKMNAETLSVGVSMKLFNSLWFCLPIKHYRRRMKSGPAPRTAGFALSRNLSANGGEGN